MTSSPSERQSSTGTSASGNVPSRGAWVRWLYLSLAIAGAIWPWMANLEFIQNHGQPFNIDLFISLANANAAAQSLSRDLIIGATAVIVWMVRESRRLEMKGLAWVLLGCVTVAFAFGAPLFLYLRERRLMELSRQAATA